ncbi:MAG: 2,3,4,5-tetrahydropyridine-2,6-dicarboxylate N-succinyltransferase [Pyrinomonadaceae bacterium]
MSLREDILELDARSNSDGEAVWTQADRKVFDAFKAALNRGEVRAAERDENKVWRVNSWVKRGILLGFRMGTLADMSDGKALRFFDKDTYPTRALSVADNVRVVPGGSSIRDGVYVASGVVCMPPMYANVGAYIDEGTMIDSHALVGSCAQIGKRVHLSAAAQVGGVLEPIGAVPVIIEDDVLVGGGCGVYEGTIIRERAVLAPGTILTGSTPVYDLVREQIYRRTETFQLEIPEGAVVVPGTRAVESRQGREWNLSLYAPVIVKYRDAKTDRAAQLEDYLR